MKWAAGMPEVATRACARNGLWRQAGRRAEGYAHAMQAVLEAGEVADGGGRPSTLAKGPAADNSHRSGVCTGV